MLVVAFDPGTGGGVKVRIGVRKWGYGPTAVTALHTVMVGISG